MRKNPLPTELIEVLRSRLTEAERELIAARDNADAADVLRGMVPKLRAAGSGKGSNLCSPLAVEVSLALSGSTARLKRAELDLKTIRQYQRCGAKTRKGTPCQSRPEAGRDRCKFHGGKSTGPKTEAGREAIRESNRRRAQKRREELAGG